MLRHAIRINAAVTRFIRDESGGMMTMTVVLFPMLLGFAGLGIDVVSWYMERRTTQSLVDTAAVEGAHHSVNYDGATMQDLVYDFALTRGYDPNQDTLTINYPPLNGTYAGEAGYVEVINTRATQLYFISAFYGIFNGEDFTVNVQSRGVAGALVIGGACVVALSPSSNRAMNFTGTTTVTSDCGIASNSTSESSIQVGGDATVALPSATTVGNYREIGGGAITDADGNPIVPQTLASEIANPYDGFVPPTPEDSPCTFENNNSPVDPATVGTAVDDGFGNITYHLSPGTYCGGIKVQSNVVFDEGIYIIHNGDFDANAGAEMSGSNVGFFLTGDTEGDVGGMKQNGQVSMDFSATESGEYAGILFYQDLTAPGNHHQDLSFNGGADMSLDGVIYAPYGDVNMNGGASAAPSCLKIYGYTVEFSGSSHVGNDETVCSAIGLSGEGSTDLTRVQLVE